MNRALLWSKWLVVLGALALPGFSAHAGVGKADNFLILGVIASDQAKAGVALIKDDSTSRTFAVREGAKINTDLMLVKVDRRQVTVMMDGVHHVIKVGQFTRDAQRISTPASFSIASLGGGLEVDGNVVRVTSVYRDHMLNENLGQILMQAAAVPYYSNNGLAGFTLWEIEKESVFEMFGLKDGDTILAINGQEIRDVGSTIRTLNELRDQANVRFTYMRDGKTQEMEIQVQ